MVFVVRQRRRTGGGGSGAGLGFFSKGKDKIIKPEESVEGGSGSGNLLLCLTVRAKLSHRSCASLYKILTEFEWSAVSVDGIFKLEDRREGSLGIILADAAGGNRALSNDFQGSHSGGSGSGSGAVRAAIAEAAAGTPVPSGELPDTTAPGFAGAGRGMAGHQTGAPSRGAPTQGGNGSPASLGGRSGGGSPWQAPGGATNTRPGGRADVRESPRVREAARYAQGGSPGRREGAMGEGGEYIDWVMSRDRPPGSQKMGSRFDAAAAVASISVASGSVEGRGAGRGAGGRDGGGSTPPGAGGGTTPATGSPAVGSGNGSGGRQQQPRIPSPHPHHLPPLVNAAMQRVQQLTDEWSVGAAEDEKLVLGRAIGRGAFGTVFLGRWRNLDVAVKVCIVAAPRCCC